MGLCKCSKKKVTNQFCFEHRVNVCEHCMVSNHSKCVVQSYLQWLQDSDYDPNCHLCKTELAEGDCIRLTCYHVFHWECINKYANSLHPQTPSSGYACPICNVCIFPQSNAVSPVTDALKTALLRVSWAKIGLDYPTCWSDHKSSIKARNLSLKKDRSKTGGGQCLTQELTQEEQRVLHLIGHDAENGLGVPESEPLPEGYTVIPVTVEYGAEPQSPLSVFAAFTHDPEVTPSQGGLETITLEDVSATPSASQDNALQAGDVRLRSLIRKRKRVKPLVIQPENAKRLVEAQGGISESLKEVANALMTNNQHQKQIADAMKANNEYQKQLADAMKEKNELKRETLALETRKIEAIEEFFSAIKQKFNM